MASPDVERYDERLISQIDDAEVPVFTVGIGGFVGAPFYLRAGKQGFPDGLTIVTQSEKGRQTETRYDAEPDLVFKHRHLYQQIRPRDPFWTFEREDWHFGSTKVLVVQVLPRTIDRGFDGKGFIVVLELACIKPALMQALSADELLLERLNNLSIEERRDDTTTVSTPPTSIDASRVHYSATVAGSSFDPLDVARRAREFRRGQTQPRAPPRITPTQPADRVNKRGISPERPHDEVMPFVSGDQPDPTSTQSEAIYVTDPDDDDDDDDEGPQSVRRMRSQTVEVVDDEAKDEKVAGSNVGEAGQDKLEALGDDDTDDNDLPLTELIKRSASAKVADEKEVEQAPRRAPLSRRSSNSSRKGEAGAVSDRRSMEKDNESFDEADLTAIVDVGEPRRRSRRLMAKERKFEPVKPTFDQEMLAVVRSIWHRPLGGLLAEEEAAEIMVADNPKEIALLAKETAENREKERLEREEDEKHRDEHETDPTMYIPVDQVPLYIRKLAGGDLDEPVRRTQLDDTLTDDDDEDDLVDAQPSKKKAKDGSKASITFIEQHLQRRWQSLERLKKRKAEWYHQLKADASKRSLSHARAVYRIASRLYGRW